jgi:2-polyprenyl-3-methyl-5-hydroxy-6-metoxy-1,4-benzoquinol methylase
MGTPNMCRQNPVTDCKTHILRLLPKFSIIFFLVSIASRLFSQDVCQDYTAWLRAHPVMESDPGAEYRDELIRRGMSTDEADTRLAQLWKSFLECPEASALTADRVYRWKKLPYNTEPNAFLIEMTQDIKPGTALDVAMGQGRNSIYLAKKGWDVTGFDVSDEGLALARKGADQAGVKINAVHQGWEEFDFGKNKWDLIVLTYAWVPIGDPVFIKRLCSSLRPGGLIVFEDAEGDVPDGIPAAVRPNEALRVFQNELRILRYEDVEAASDWSNRKKTQIARLLAKK